MKSTEDTEEFAVGGGFVWDGSVIICENLKVGWKFMTPSVECPLGWVLDMSGAIFVSCVGDQRVGEVWVEARCVVKCRVLKSPEKFVVEIGCEARVREGVVV